MGVILSVEPITGSIDGAGDTTTSIALGLSQDETNCVPFFTVRNTSSGDATDVFANRLFEIFFDNSGGPRVNFRRRSTSGTQGTFEIHCFVVEFDPAKVNIQQNVTSLSSPTIATQVVTAVDQDKSFIVSNFSCSAGTDDDFNGHTPRARFLANDKISLEKGITTSTLQIRTFVVECIGSEFSTQFVQPLLTGSTITATDTLTAVTLAKTFLIGQWDTDETGDDAKDCVCRFDIQDTTTVRMRRDHGGSTPSARVSGDMWAVEAANTEWDVQDFPNMDLGGASPHNQTLSPAIDQDLTVIVHQNSQGQGMPVFDWGAGNAYDDLMEQTIFTSDTNVRFQRAARTDTTLLTSFSTVEFELSVAAAGLVTRPLPLRQPLIRH